MDQEIIAAIVALIGAVSAAIVWGIRLLFKKLSTFLSELKPNGGSSMKDQVNRLELRIDQIYQILANRK
jgi:hypothetical protein